MAQKRKAPVTFKQRKAFDILVGDGGSVTQAMIKAGYSPNTANTPQKLTESKAWKDWMSEYLSDEVLAKKHEALLRSTRIEHMVFPLGPKGEDDPNFSGAKPDDNEEDDGIKRERTSLTDEEIKEMLAEINCKVRRIVHGETARHVYYWAQDNKAVKDALDMAYKLKGSYAAEKSVVATINLTPENVTPDAIKLAEDYEQKLRESMFNEQPTVPNLNPRVVDRESNQEREGGPD